MQDNGLSGAVEHLKSADAPRLREVQTTQDLANDIRARLVAAYQPVCAILDEAVAAGFIVQSQLGEGPLGKQAILALQVLKKY